jgi:hypothetical protein
VYSPNQNKSHSYGKFEDTETVNRKKMKMTYNAMSNDQQKMTKKPKQKIFYESNIYGPCETNLLLFTGCRLPTIHFNAGNKQSHQLEWA